MSQNCPSADGSRTVASVSVTAAATRLAATKVRFIRPHPNGVSDNVLTDPRPLLESVVESVAGARAAEQAGAARLELCSRLVDGGVTPAAGLVTAVLERVSIPVFVMIRPRPGDFVYSDTEIADALHDVTAVRRRGAHGIVTGVL